MPVPVPLPVPALLHQIEHFTAKESCALTIGNFDGMHVGHQALLKHLVSKKLHSTVLTFSNHPLTVLSHERPLEITTVDHKILLFKELRIDTVLLLPFTEEFSKQSPDFFLNFLQKYIPFSHLVLGYDGVIGHAREGDRPYLEQLAQKLKFQLEYFPPVCLDGQPISSRKIRTSIQQGDLSTAARYLGRPFSIYSKVMSGKAMGRVLGFKTINLPTEGRVLPPHGVYVVHVRVGNQTLLGVANLGSAPTLHQDRPPLIEVHILDVEENFYEREVEVIFIKYLRSEKKFDSVETLKQQIVEDILATRSFAASN